MRGLVSAHICWMALLPIVADNFPVETPVERVWLEYVSMVTARPHAPNTQPHLHTHTHTHNVVRGEVDTHTQCSEG